MEERSVRNVNKIHVFKQEIRGWWKELEKKDGKRRG